MKTPDIGARVVFVLGTRLFFGRVITYKLLHDSSREYNEAMPGVLMRAGKWSTQELLHNEGIYWTRGWNLRAALALRAAKALAS